MLISRPSNSQLTHRLDPSFYDERLIADADAIEQFNPVSLDSLRDQSVSISYGVVKPVLTTSLDYRIARIQDFDDPFLNVGRCAGLREDRFQVFRRAECIEGDLLIAIAGYVGRAAIVPRIKCRLNINQHIARFRVSQSQPVDTYYLVSFLTSCIGAGQLRRWVSGSVQAGINLEDLRRIRVPCISQTAQKYIGDKLRIAQRLRVYAQECRAAIDTHFRSYDAASLVTMNHKSHSRVNRSDMSARLNAEFYSEKYRSIERSLRSKSAGLLTLDDVADIIRTKQRPRAECLYREIGDIDTTSGEFGPGTRYPLSEVPNNAQRIFEAGDIAVSTRRPNRGAIALVNESDPNTYYSVFLARVKPRDPSHGFWIKEYLRSPIGRLLLEQRCTWTTYPVISEDDLATVPIPNDQHGWTDVQRLSETALRLESVANSLAIASRILVDSIVQSTMNEVALTNAYNELVDGNDDLDRELLRRLYEGGIDATGTKALFPDLDAYYETLQMADNALADGDDE